MTKKLTIAVIALSAIAGTAVSFAFKSKKSPVVGTLTSHDVIIRISNKDLIAKSDLIVAGQIVGFDPSEWNRDNPPTSIQEWENSPSNIRHQIRVEVLKSFKGTVPKGLLKITAWGPSPVNPTVKFGTGEQTLFAQSDGDAIMKIGDRGLFFLNTKQKQPWITSGKTIYKTGIGFASNKQMSFAPEIKASGKYSLMGETYTAHEIANKISTP